MQAPEPKIKVLFLCTGNSCRSQMAEGWARFLKAGVIEPFSAGIEKHGLNPYAVKVMAEAGVDISRPLVQDRRGAWADSLRLCRHGLRARERALSRLSWQSEGGSRRL